MIIIDTGETESTTLEIDGPSVAAAVCSQSIARSADRPPCCRVLAP